MAKDVDRRSGLDLRAALVQALRRAGWKVDREPLRQDATNGPDLVVRKGDLLYVVAFKKAPEPRRDRVIPLFAQAVVEAAAIARRAGVAARPLAVIASSHVPESLQEDVQRFARDFVPDVSLGIIDADGFRYFSDPALRALNAARPPRRSQVQVAQQPADPFSDLNQWMLKVLLAPGIPREYLSAPRGAYRNASELARAADVSLMSAFRFVRQFEDAHFLETDGPRLRVVRIEELMRRWQTASVRGVREFPAGWILGGGGPGRLDEALRRHIRRLNDGQTRDCASRRAVRMCLGLYAAAERLGLGFVRGAAPHVYLERLDVDALRELGLALSQPASGPADVMVRIPSRSRAIFRAAVQVQEVPVSDVLQIWLDVQSHPARGKQQAEEIRGRALRSLFPHEQQ
jgi:hypothetical protein